MRGSGLKSLFLRVGLGGSRLSSSSNRLGGSGGGGLSGGSGLSLFSSLGGGCGGSWLGSTLGGDGSSLGGNWRGSLHGFSFTSGLFLSPFSNEFIIGFMSLLGSVPKTLLFSSISSLSSESFFSNQSLNLGGLLSLLFGGSRLEGSSDGSLLD